MTASTSSLRERRRYRATKERIGWSSLATAVLSREAAIRDVLDLEAGTASSSSKQEDSMFKGLDEDPDSTGVCPPLLAEASRMLSVSLFVYLFADLRLLSKLGKTKLPMDYLSLESDEMTVSELVKGVPHILPAYDPTTGGSGKSGNDIFLALLRVLSTMALPHRQSSPSNKFQKAFSKIKQLWDDRDRDQEDTTDVVKDVATTSGQPVQGEDCTIYKYSLIRFMSAGKSQR